MESLDDGPTMVNQLAILACQLSGIDPYHVRDGRMMYELAESQARGRLALNTLAGSGREMIR
jgi:hypothetical protein